MTSRTTRSVVRFTQGFILPGLDEPLPAGEYEVDVDEESIDGDSWQAFRRVATFIHLPGAGGSRQMLQVDPEELEVALKRDRAAGPETVAERHIRTDTDGTRRRDQATAESNRLR